MWNRADFDKLTGNIHFPVVVDWDKKPSSGKYGHVNSLLAVICALQKHEASFTDAAGAAINSLTIASVKRRLTDQHKKKFSIVGHNTARPMLIAYIDELQVEVYFNHHFLFKLKLLLRSTFPPHRSFFDLAISLSGI
jgi:hypothetical protein